MTLPPWNDRGTGASRRPLVPIRCLDPPGKAKVTLLPGQLPVVVEGPALRAREAGAGLLAGGGGLPLELYPPPEPSVQVQAGLGTVWPLRDPLVDKIVQNGQWRCLRWVSVRGRA